MTTNPFGLKSKLFQICRLCLSEEDVKWSLFDDDGLKRNFPCKILSCLCIPVSNYLSSQLTQLSNAQILSLED